MNRFRKIIRYTKPLTEIDEKINRLNEMMVTGGMYSYGLTTPSQPGNGIPKIPDKDYPLYDGNYGQPDDNDDTSDLTAENDVPLTAVMDISNCDVPEGTKAIAMAYHTRRPTGREYGFIDQYNVFHGVFVLGGLNPSGRGQTDCIDDGLDWYEEYVTANPSATTVQWRAYSNTGYITPPLATNVGPGGIYDLYSHNLILIPNPDDIIVGNIPSVFLLLTRDALGDYHWTNFLEDIADLVINELSDDLNQLAGWIQNLVNLYNDGSPTFAQLWDYTMWIGNPTEEYTETELTEQDKQEIITTADEVLSVYFNPNGSPKTSTSTEDIEALVANAIQNGIDNNSEATNIHGQLEPPTGEVISLDGDGGININDGFGLDKVTAFESDDGVGIGDLVSQAIEGSAISEVDGPIQPIQTNLTADELQGTLLGNIINYNNLFESTKSAISESKSKLNDKNKLFSFISLSKKTLKKWKNRYPSSDPRLAELNWKNDKMVKASNAYINQQFPENVKQTSRVKKLLARNIELTDPKTFEESKQPTIFKNLYENYTDNKKLKVKESARKFFGKGEKKKSYNSVLRHVSMTDVKKNTRKLQEQKLIDEQCHQEELDLPKYNSPEYSNWRFDMDEET